MSSEGLLCVIFGLIHVVTHYASDLPNFVVMLTDDLGWNSAWNNNETITPFLDDLSQKSIVLESFYTYKYCSPTRASFLTGRFPYKLCSTRNNLNPAYIPEGINLGYTMLPRKLAEAGYVSYHVGKWHQGMHTSHYTPHGRGFNHSYGFLSGGEDHYNQHNFWGCKQNVTNGEASRTRRTTTRSVPAVDLYNTSKPALGENGTYNGYLFTKTAVEYIKYHSVTYPDRPFFLYFALHNTHAPCEAPTDFKSMYDFNQTLRNEFDAMVSVVDSSVKNVTNALKTIGATTTTNSNFWNNTVFVWTTDNGAPVSVGGSNKPFRGSKSNNFEGGVHVPALVTGGYLTKQLTANGNENGNENSVNKDDGLNTGFKKLTGMIHITDLYATFCRLAGVDPTETNPLSPSPIDSIDMWSYINGTVSQSPRNVIIHDHLMYSDVTQGAIRYEQYKLVIMNESQASWYGQFSPNETWNSNMEDIYACGVETPCLFDIENDPTEHHDLSKIYPNITANLTKLFYSFDSEYHPPKNAPSEDVQGYCNAVYQNGGFIVPWLDNDTVVKK